MAKGDQPVAPKTVIILGDEVILVWGLEMPKGNEEIAEAKRQKMKMKML